MTVPAYYFTIIYGCMCLIYDCFVVLLIYDLTRLICVCFDYCVRVLCYYVYHIMLSEFHVMPVSLYDAALCYVITLLCYYCIRLLY